MRLSATASRRWIGDQAWFELQFSPEEARADYGIPLPDLPPDEVQMGFTARTGRANLQQAFDFYRYILTTCQLPGKGQPQILDFGGGWGRISRFFLRETEPESIVIAECMTYAVHWLHETKNPCHVIKNDPLPPIQGLSKSFDLIYAFSVFSHLSEEASHSWITYLMDRLVPGGYLVLTTRGLEFIDQLEKLHRHPDPTHERLRTDLPAPALLRERHLKGDFQFYPIGGAGELTPDFYGETFIPRSYIEKRYGSILIDFTEEVPNVDQSVIVLRKPFKTIN